MKNHFITLALVICAILQINGKQIQSTKQPSAPTKQTTTTDKFAKWKKLWAQTKQALKPMSRDEQIQHQVNMILEWSRSKTKEELNQIKDSIQFLNPRLDDSDIMIEAKKIAKEQLFPTQKSYWQQYAPQFMQNAIRSTKNYIFYLTPQFITDRLYPTSTMTITKQIDGKRQTITIKNPEKMTPQELQKALELNIPTQLPATKSYTFHYSQEQIPQQHENNQEKIENWLKLQNQ